MSSTSIQFSCRQANELLPWLLNGSLEDDERMALVDHLAGCEHCCGELEESARAWELATWHVPSLALAESAQGLPPGDCDREEIERHLELCPSCRQELAWATADRVLDFEAERAPAASPRRRPKISARWRRLAVAATVLAALGVGAAIRSLVEWDGVSNRDGFASRPAAVDVSEAAGTQPAPDAETGGLFLDGFESGSMVAWTRAVVEDSRTQTRRRM